MSESIKEIEKQLDSDRPRCQCGCGLRVGKQKNGDWVKYFSGHKTRKPPEGNPPMCACGECGQPVSLNKKTKRWNKYIKGHQIYNYNKTDQAKEHWKTLLPTMEQRAKLRQRMITYNNSDEGVKHREYFIGLTKTEERRKYSSNHIQEFNDSPAGKQHRERFFNDPAIQEKRAIGIKNNWQSSEFIAKWFAACTRLPNKPEKWIDSLTPDYVRYVGNGKWHRRITLQLPDGTIVKKNKNPDFIVTDCNGNVVGVMEFNGMPWHKDDPPDEVFIEAWKREGIALLIIWDYELKDIPKMVQRIADFIGQEQWQMTLAI